MVAVRSLANALRDMVPNTTIVAIDGPGGAGKSTVAGLLAGAVGGADVVHVDNFYRPSNEQGDDGSPGSMFDLDRLANEVLTPLHSGLDARYQRYDWDDDALADWIIIPRRRPMVIIEGVYSASPDLRMAYDAVVWVTAPSETRLERGVARDGEDMRSTWTDVWMPVEDRYATSTGAADRATVVIDGALSPIDDGELLVVRAAPVMAAALLDRRQLPPT